MSVNDLRLVFTVNVALQKTAFQSSTYQTGDAPSVVDGDPNTVSCTPMSSAPWWSVDLGTQMDVSRVEVTNDRNPNFG